MKQEVYNVEIFLRFFVDIYVDVVDFRIDELLRSAFVSGRRNEKNQETYFDTIALFFTRLESKALYYTFLSCHIF